MSAPALPTICPRCLRRLVRNHDELVCLTHGQVFEPVRAWETAPAVVASGVTARGGEQKRVRGMSPTAVPWTDEERDLWRRAEAGEEFAPPVPEEEEPVSDFAPKSVDDLAGPALARLRELASQVEKAEALAHSLRAEALRFVQVLDLKTYGRPLETFNGRNPAQDAYEEALDLAVYLRQLLEERAVMLDLLRDALRVLPRGRAAEAITRTLGADPGAWR